MFYKCLECGHVFEEGKEAVWLEDRGEYWGVHCSEKMCGCPKCKGEYEKAVKCEICGEYHFFEELNGGVCDGCIDKYSKDFKVCYNISFGETQSVEINSLLACLFEPSDIEAILKEYIKEKCLDIDYTEYVEQDKDWFGQQLVKEVKKNEHCKK